YNARWLASRRGGVTDGACSTMSPKISSTWRFSPCISLALVTVIPATVGFDMGNSRAGEFHVVGQAIFNSTVTDHYDLTEPIQAGDVAKFDDISHVPDYSVHGQGDSLADIGGLHAHAFAQIVKNVTN